MIRLTKLTTAFPGGGFESSRKISSSLAYNGYDFLQTVQMLRTHGDSFSGGMMFSVLLPCMYQAVELLTKALILVTDPAATAKGIGHKTVQAMGTYRARVPIFDKFLSDPNLLALLEGLESGYTQVRYAEVTIYFEGTDVDECCKMVCDMLDAYNAITKIPILRWHFPTQ